MYKEAILTIKQSIFPIFFKHVQGNVTTLGVSGTGFFINDIGHFMTANHVINDVPKGAEILFAGNVPHNIIQPVNISEKLINEERDLYFGKVEEYALPPVKLYFGNTDIGTSVCLCGYPLAQLGQNPDGSINVNNVRQYWQPTFSIDGAHINHNGKKYEGFITQDTSLRGMSGGPVFDTDGNVIGIDVATFTRQIKLQNGENMPVNNGVVASLNSIQAIIESVINS